MTATTITRTDQELQSEVLDELTSEPYVRPNEIGVAVTEGVVTLTGEVESHALRWAAERATHRVDRVRAVANDIVVELASSTGPTDREIATAVTRTLEWDAFTPIERLAVTVSDGQVTIRGEVDWEYQRRTAEWSVRRLAGVRGLSNGIVVRPANGQPGPG